MLSTRNNFWKKLVAVIHFRMGELLAGIAMLLLGFVGVLYQPAPGQNLILDALVPWVTIVALVLGVCLVLFAWKMSPSLNEGVPRAGIVFKAAFRSLSQVAFALAFIAFVASLAAYAAKHEPLKDSAITLFIVFAVFSVLARLGQALLSRAGNRALR